MNAVPSAGEQLFARFAHSPNELGYCGPETRGMLAAAARGEAVAGSVRRVATGFSGAWVYQELVGELLGRDPMDPEVVRGYWLGTGVVDAIDPAEFWERLLAVIGPRAGAYWRHLDAGLAPEAHPGHAFHVLGVYPWSRLLVTGRPEPIGVLDSCCIRPAVVRRVGDDDLELESLALEYSAGELRLVSRVETGVPHPFDPALAVGDAVAVHWGAVCAVLSPGESAALEASLERQLARTAPRLRAELG